MVTRKFKCLDCAADCDDEARDDGKKVQKKVKTSKVCEKEIMSVRDSDCPSSSIDLLENSKSWR